MSRTKRNPASPAGKLNDAGSQVDTPKGSAPSVAARGAFLFPHLPPAYPLNLDEHQVRAIEAMADRLGGTPNEVVEFLVTTGLYVLQFDELAEGRVRRGVERLFGDSEISKAIMGDLVDLECNVKNEVWNFKVRTLRPRMAGDWRGVAQPEA